MQTTSGSAAAGRRAGPADATAASLPLAGRWRRRRVRSRAAALRCFEPSAFEAAGGVLQLVPYGSGDTLGQAVEIPGKAVAVQVFSCLGPDQGDGFLILAANGSQERQQQPHPTCSGAPNGNEWRER